MGSYLMCATGSLNCIYFINLLMLILINKVKRKERVGNASLISLNRKYTYINMGVFKKLSGHDLAFFDHPPTSSGQFGTFSKVISKPV